MKIIDLKTFVVGNPWKNWIFVKLYTDEGITGLGEATGGLATKSILGDLEELKRFIIGEDPRYPEVIWYKMYKGRYLGTSPAMSGIELACWDILGKTLGVPVWQLLGGKHREYLRVYANGWYRGPRDPKFFAEKAKELAERGYTALKFDPFGSAYLQIDRENERKAIEIVRAIREAVGPDVDILIEGHDRFTLSTAIRIGKYLEEFQPLWFETPVKSTDIKASIEVARDINIPVALGERFSRLEQFAEVLSERVINIIQPEVLNLGLANAKKICGMAEAYGALIACHQAQSPLCTAINTHLHASIPNFLIQENFDDFLEPWTWEVLTGVPRVEKGCIKVSDTPGWGVELNEKEIEKYPYGPENFLLLFEDGWEMRRPRNLM